MFECVCRKEELCLKIPACLEEVDQVAKRMQDWLEELGLGEHLFRLTLLLREGLNNAVVHGAGNDSNKSVFLYIGRKGEEIIIRIKDPGPGMDPTAGERPCCSPDHCSADGWGLSLLHRYGDGVDYDSEKKATEIVYSLQHGEQEPPEKE